MSGTCIYIYMCLMAGRVYEWRMSGKMVYLWGGCMSGAGVAKWYKLYI
jgi:hypothetical protein